MTENQRDVELFIFIEQTPNQVTEQIKNFTKATQDTRATADNQRAFNISQSIYRKENSKNQLFFSHEYLYIYIAVIENAFFLKK